jgi:hypothetical protein
VSVHQGLNGRLRLTIVVVDLRRVVSCCQQGNESQSVLGLLDGRW